MFSKHNCCTSLPCKPDENTHSKIHLVYPYKLYKYFSYHSVFSALPVFKEIWNEIAMKNQPVLPRDLVMLHSADTYSILKEGFSRCVFLSTVQSLSNRQNLSWFSGSKLVVYYQYSGSSFSGQFTAERSSTRPWWSHRTCTVNCNLKRSGKMTREKAPLF